MASRTESPHAGDLPAGSGSSSPAAPGLLSLAAMPILVVMALWTAMTPAPADVICSAGAGGLSPNGMTTMYALMGLLHLSPWMKLLDRVVPTGL